MNTKPPPNATTRFSDRVENYLQYRPGYPADIIPFLVAQAGLHNGQIVCDVGSGTGKLTTLFVEFGCHTIGVEPNEAMREAAEEMWGSSPHFTSVGGSAEETELEENSVDLIVAGQAFHWFEPTQARREFGRILRPNGSLCLVWNERQQSDPFQHAYDRLLRQHAADYAQVNHRNITLERIAQFFAPHTVDLKTFPYSQQFDLAGLIGRACSSSYTPKRDDPQYPLFLTALTDLFERYQVAGQVQFSYDTKVYWGRFSA